MQAATYPWILTIDGNCQNEPADIQKLLSIAENIHQEHKAIVVGIRKQSDEPWQRRLLTKISHRIRQLLLKDDCPDPGCNLKLFPKATFINIPHFNHMHRFIPALFKREGYKIINVPVSQYRRERPPKIRFPHHVLSRLSDFFGVMWLNRRRCRPELKND